MLTRLCGSDPQHIDDVAEGLSRSMVVLVSGAFVLVPVPVPAPLAVLVPAMLVFVPVELVVMLELASYHPLGRLP